MEQFVYAAVIFIVALAGTILQGATGFGMAIICMALLPFMLPLNLIQVTVMLLGGFSSFMILWQLRRHLDWKLIQVPLFTMIAVRYIGVWLVSGALSLELIKGILGGIMIVLSIYLGFWKDKVHFNPTITTGLIAGTISGLMGGMFNIGGPPMVAYMIVATNDKMKYSSCLQLTFCIGALSNTIFRGVQGTLIPESGIDTLVLCVAAGVLASLIGTRIGVGFLKRLDLKRLTIGVCCVMALSGIVSILQSLSLI